MIMLYFKRGKRTVEVGLPIWTKIQEAFKTIDSTGWIPEIRLDRLGFVRSHPFDAEFAETFSAKGKVLIQDIMTDPRVEEILTDPHATDSAVSIFLGKFTEIVEFLGEGGGFSVACPHLSGVPHE